MHVSHHHSTDTLFASNRMTVTAVNTAATALFEFLYAALKDKANRVRAEDMIVVAASIVGERCIDAAGNYAVRSHTFRPGSHVMSEQVNVLLCGDSSDVSLAAVPAASVFGMLRDRLTAHGYSVAEFPDFHHVFQYFVAHVDSVEWGKVPLSAPEVNWPRIIPLRVTYESRPAIDKLFASIDDVANRLHAATLALASTLEAVEGVIEHRVALSLAFETINAMSKTAPMTDAAMADVPKSQ
jgi:hypothetical protein